MVEKSPLMMTLRAIGERNLKHFYGLVGGATSGLGEGAIPATPAPKPGPPNMVVTIATLKAPFASGDPQPAFGETLPGGENYSAPNVFACGDPARGELSIGLVGGVTTADDVEWSQQPSATLFPDRWRFGDQVSANASVTSVFPFDATPDEFSSIDISAAIRWGDQPSAGADLTQEFYKSFELRAGDKSAPLNGYVSVYAAVYLTVAMANEHEILRTTSSFNQFMDVAIDADHHGNQEFAPIESFLRLDSAFNPEPFQQLLLQSSCGFPAGANRIITQVSAYLTGRRGGVNDPNAGYLATGFCNPQAGGGAVKANFTHGGPLIIDHIKIDGQVARINPSQP